MSERNPLPAPPNPTGFATRGNLPARLKRKNLLAVLFIWLSISSAVAAAIYANIFLGSDRWLYDRALHGVSGLRASQAMAVPQAEQAVFIEIDEYSLSALGRWPWARSTHAKLIERLNSAPPLALAFDIIFAQPESIGVSTLANDSDAILGQAIAQAKYPIILAAQLDRIAGRSLLVRPMPPIGQTPSRLAHIHANPDDDGTLRSIFLQEGFVGYQPLPYLGFAMLNPRLAPRADEAFTSQTTLARASADDISTSQWRTQKQLWLYPTRDGEVLRVSYIDILNGKIDPKIWQGKRVLVAATAVGMGDRYVSPIFSNEPIVVGGEIVLAALLTQQKINQGAPAISLVDASWQWLQAALITLLVLLGLRRLSLWAQAAWLVACLTFYALVSSFIFARLGLWLSPSASIAAALGATIGWQLLRLRTVLTTPLSDFPTQNTPIQTLFKQVSPYRQTGDEKTKLSVDPIDAHLLSLSNAHEAQLALRDALAGILQVLPDATFVLRPPQAIDLDTATDLHLWLANDAAYDWMHTWIPRKLNTQHITYAKVVHALKPVLTRAQQNALDGKTFHWDMLLRKQLPEAFSSGVEAHCAIDDASVARFLVKINLLPNWQSLSVQPASLFEELNNAYVLSLVDLTVSQQLTAQRDASLQFLSHDLRSPQVAILAMLQMEAPKHPQLADLLNRIGAEAQRTLDLAEGFVQLTRAEQSEIYQFTPYDLNDFAVEASDELWAPAAQKQIKITTELYGSPLIINADRTMFWRVMVNLLSNAVRYSPAQSTITISTRLHGTQGWISITDQGKGIEPRVLANLFEKFNQGSSATSAASTAQGAGLGLAFVKTVVEQHTGSIQAHSPCFDAPTSHGTQFVMQFPILLIDSDDAADEG